MSALKEALDALISAEPDRARRERDPVGQVHRFAAPEDQEVMAFFAALLAYGRAPLIVRALEDVARRLCPSPAQAALSDTPETAAARFEGFVYRMNRGADLAHLLLGLGRLLRAHGSLGQAARAFDQPESPDLRPMLAGFVQALRGPVAPPGFAHLAADPLAGSPVKRWCLLLRWLVRGPDGVDLGLWRGLSPARLTIPLDTHVHRLSLSLGLTTRATADWRTAAEITAHLRSLCPEDPLRYDLALAHLGISGRCTRRGLSQCEVCPLVHCCTDALINPV